tara:strand:- start:19581 stop:19970 length:390 start_codon:yes stop_codon:yes gene_type:complete
MLEENKKIVSDKSLLFAATEPKLYYLKISESSEEHLKIWVKEPTWLQVEAAMASVMKINAKTQEMDIDLNNLYHYMIDNFVDKTEPSLGKVDLIRLSPYLGSQLKDILPNPLQELTGDDTKNEESETQS